MHTRHHTFAIAVAIVGLALVILESVQTLRSQTLGTLGTILLYVGLGLFVIAAAVFVSRPTRD